MTLELDEIVTSVQEHTEAMSAFAGETRKRLGDIESAMNLRAAPVAQKARGPRLITKDGREIQCLTKTDRFADLGGTLPDGIRAGELDFGRLLKAAASGDWRKAQAEQRAMGTGINAAGGFLVPDPLSAAVVDLARNSTCVLEAGAIVVPMDSSTLTFARIVSDPVPGWKGENAAGTETSVVFGSGTLSANTLMGLVKCSVELIEDAVNAGELVMQTLAKTLALEADRAYLYGSGSGAQPNGIKNKIAAGVQEVTSATNGDTITNFDKLLTARGLLLNTNTDIQNMAVIMAPRTATNFSKLKTGISGDNTSLLAPPEVAAMKRFVTNQVPINLTQGSSGVSTDIFTGDFSQAYVGIRKAIQMEVSREASDSSSSAFKNLQVWIRAYMRTDIILARYDNFAICTGIVA